MSDGERIQERRGERSEAERRESTYKALLVVVFASPLLPPPPPHPLSQGLRFTMEMRKQTIDISSCREHSVAEPLAH